MSDVGKRLREARDKKRLTQVEVFTKIGINNKTLSGYENGVSFPDLETLKILSELYGVSTDFLLDKKEKDAVDRLIEYLDLELTDDEIIERMTFKVDTLTLSPDEVREFVAFVRAKRFMKSGRQVSPSKSEGQ
jgi:transcriptional regulator with XRE-family HTH domain